MFRYRLSHAFIIFAFGSLITATSSVRCVRADTGDVVDLDGDTHNKPPASTTDTSTKAPSAARDSDNAIQKGAKEARDAAKDEAAAEKLKLRAGERVGSDPRGKAQVLGMALQEAAHERVKVVDVAMNSPAFAAGVMKGDEIVAFQGFRGESYRKWIDGIRRLTADTGAGLKIPVVVARDGKQLTVRIEVAEEPVRASIPRVLAQPDSPLIPPVVGQPMPAPGSPTAVAVNGGNNVAIGSGPFGDFFGGEAASPNEGAMAQIVRIGGQPSPNPGAARSPIAGGAAAPASGNTRIGMAGFRDDPSGMVVMVDVGALPPGNYTVGISDPSVVGGAAVTGAGAANPNVREPSQLAPPQAPVPTPASGGRFVPDGAVPAPTGTRQPQGSLPPASDRLIPRTILAQVGATGEPTSADSNSGAAIDTIPPTGEARPSTIPATGEVNPSTTPATGEVNPSSSTPTGQSRVNNAQRAQGAANAGQNNNANGVGSGTLSHIGTITVDQSGTGRMQQKVEGAQVRNVVGQAIVLYSQSGTPQTTLPANLNGNAGTATRQGVVDAPTASNSPSGNNANAPQRAAGSKVPVAAGIIQLITDRRPPATTGPATSQTPAATNGTVEQPATATPSAGQNLVR